MASRVFYLYYVIIYFYNISILISIIQINYKLNLSYYFINIYITILLIFYN